MARTPLAPPPVLALLTVLCVGIMGCDKVSQCNELIATIGAHAPKMVAATENLGEIDTNPEVADAYEAAIDAATKDMQAKSFKDEKVAEFATQYTALLQSAKPLSAAMKAASHNPAQKQAAVATADQLKKAETTLVDSVNTYCSAK